MHISPCESGKQLLVQSLASKFSGIGVSHMSPLQIYVAKHNYFHNIKAFVYFRISTIYMYILKLYIIYIHKNTYMYI